MLVIHVYKLTWVQAVQCKSILALVLEEESLLLNLLQTLQPVVDESSAPATKKARLDGSDLPPAIPPHLRLTILRRQHNQPSFTADKLQPLTLLVEVIGGNQTFNGSKDLVVLLLDTLEKVVHCTGAFVAQSDITYLEQLLASATGELAVFWCVVRNLGTRSTADLVDIAFR